MSRRRTALVRSAVFVVVCLSILTAYRLWMDRPGATEAQAQSLIGQPLPAAAVVTPANGGAPYPLSDEVVGVTVINYFASWCGPCWAEVPVLLELRAEGVRIVGVAVRDRPDATQAFLDELGDPYFRVVSDPQGANLGTLGLGADMPQTLVVSRDGDVLFHHSGPLVGTDGDAAVEEIRELAGPR